MTAQTRPTESDSNRTQITCPKCGQDYPDYMTFCPFCLDDPGADLETLLDTTRLDALIAKGREAERDAWLIEQYESQAYARAVMHEDGIERGFVYQKTARAAAAQPVQATAAA